MDLNTGALPSEISREEAIDFLQKKLTSIMKQNTEYNALIEITEELARKDLAKVLAARETGHRLPLDGMFFVVKDNINVGGVRGTLGSRFFSDRVPEKDAEVVETLRKSGAIILGTSNMHELAFGATSENPHFGVVRNPWDSSRNAGGSSGGSAVSVAMGWAQFALGTDTGGSIRCPAAVSGVTGLRPTYGAVSSVGVPPLATSFDSVGFFARTATDVEKVYRLSVGEPLESSADIPPGIKVGIVSGEYFTAKTDHTTLGAVSRVGSSLEKHAEASLVALDIPEADRMDWVARMIVRAEAWRKFGQAVESEPESFGLDVVNRLLLARDISPSESEELYQERKVLADTLESLFNEVDVILLPTMPHPPSRIGQGDPLVSTEQNLTFTYLWGLAGLPAISIPCGFDDENLPIGAQLVSKPGNDLLLCRLAEVFQQHTNWHLISASNLLSEDTSTGIGQSNESGLSTRG